MKKIVSVLSVAALALSSIFAVDFSLSYKTAGALYKEENKKNYATEAAKQTRTALDQSGYADAKSDIVISTKTDWAGFVLDIDPNASDKANMDHEKTSKWFDQYYGWLNFGPLQVTSGKWKSRYGYELDDDKGTWEDSDFNRYHVGVVNGKYAHDIDNLTATLTADGTKGVDGRAKQKTVQELATAVALTSRPNDGTYIMLKGVLVDSDWGSTLRLDSDRSYTGAYADTNGTGGDLAFHSGFAGEFAFHVDNSIDINVVAKSLKRDTISLGAFVRPTLGNTTILAGFTFAKELQEYKDGDDNLRTYYEMAADFRLRTKLSDNVTLTTMHNISAVNPRETKKDQKWSDMSATMWNMVSLGYKASEKVLLQLTAHNECVLFKNEQDKPEESTKTTGPRTNGGYNISIIPGVVYSFNENASLTAGLKWDICNVFALQSWKDGQGDSYVASSTFSIPVVFKVSL